MTTDAEILDLCFEELARRDRDITAEVYRKFTSGAPAAGQHIDYMDARMRGRMLDQVYRVLLDDVDEDYLKFETSMHKGYGADAELYFALLTAVKDSFSEALQEYWSDEHDAAWNRTIERIGGKLAQLAAS